MTMRRGMPILMTAVGVAAVATVKVVTVRITDIEPVPGAGQRHVEQPTLLLDFIRGTGGHIRRDVPIGGV